MSWQSPSGLALLSDGGAGAVLVSDSGHHKLRRIDLATWTVTNWAGVGKRGHRDGAASGNDGAQFDSPGGLCVCPDGTVLVTDTGNHCLRAVTTTAHGRRHVRTVAGCPGVRGHRDGAAYVARFDSPVAVAVTAQGLEGPIYIADAGSHTLRCVSGAAVPGAAVPGATPRAGGAAQVAAVMAGASPTLTQTQALTLTLTLTLTRWRR